MNVAIKIIFYGAIAAFSFAIGAAMVSVDPGRITLVRADWTCTHAQTENRRIAKVQAEREVCVQWSRQ